MKTINILIVVKRIDDVLNKELKQLKNPLIKFTFISHYQFIKSTLDKQYDYILITHEISPERRAISIAISYQVLKYSPFSKILYITNDKSVTTDIIFKNGNIDYATPDCIKDYFIKEFKKVSKENQKGLIIIISNRNIPFYEEGMYPKGNLVVINYKFSYHRTLDVLINKIDTFLGTRNWKHNPKMINKIIIACPSPKLFLLGLTKAFYYDAKDKFIYFSPNQNWTNKMKKAKENGIKLFESNFNIHWVLNKLADKITKNSRKKEVTLTETMKRFQ